MGNWIDFKSLRSRLSFKDVLRHYRVDAKVKGERAFACCPLPNHPSRTDGTKRTASLSVNLSRNIFQCFGCKASGNVLDFCIRMEGFDPSDPTQFRTAAMKVAEQFGITGGSKPSQHLPAGTFKSEQIESVKSESPLPVTVNAPLDFALKHLDPRHPYLPKRGYTPETIEQFGLGFCAKGIMKDRIAIPVHDADGRLVGYAGRLIDDDRVNDETPKYLFPGPRERDGQRYEFHKSQLLYNQHRIDPSASDLIVVEGFASVWWLYQHGFRAVVALLGSSCSPEQADLIEPLAERIWILADGDDAGRQCEASCWHQLGNRIWCRRISLEDGQQPTDVSSDELEALLPAT